MNKSTIIGHGISHNGAEATRQPEVIAAIEDLARTQHRVGERTRQLQDRLGAILRNEPVADTNKKNPNDPHPDVQMASGIRIMNADLRCTEEVLEDILRRLEI